MLLSEHIRDSIACLSLSSSLFPLSKLELEIGKNVMIGSEGNLKPKEE